MLYCMTSEAECELRLGELTRVRDYCGASWRGRGGGLGKVSDYLGTREDSGLFLEVELIRLAWRGSQLLGGGG